MKDWSRYHGLFDFMAQRDDAKDAGNDAEFNYWRGYLDAVADMDGLTDEMDAAETAYREMQEWAAESMDDVARTARRRISGQAGP